MHKLLGDICEFVYGESLPERMREEGSVPVYGSNGIIGWHSKSITKKETIIVGRKGSIGAVNLSEVPCWPIDTTYYVKHRENVHYKWLYHCLKNLKLDNLNSASAVPGLNRNDAYGKKIVFPPLETQKKIAVVLDKAQELTDKRKEQLAKMDEFVQSVFLEMFGNPVSNPKGWPRKPFGSYIDVLTDYHANGSYEILRDNVELLDQGNYALMVRTTDLENNNFQKNVKYITRDAYEFLAKTKVYGGEVIINKIGSAGKVYLMPYLNRPVSLGMNQFMIRLLNGLNNIYVYHLFNTASGSSLILNNVRGAVTKTITKDAIRGIVIQVPPLDLQNQFTAIVEKTEQQKVLMQQSLAEMENNMSSLMQRAFKGELW